SQRVVFTTLGAGAAPAKQSFDDSTTSADALKSALSRPSPTTAFTTAEAQGLIRRVLAGYKASGSSTYKARLGRADRSTPVVVGTSALANSSRPTMIYFGALDGMIHAVCVEAVTPCTSAGQELWAFIPGGQLSSLWQNKQRIDGSPTALDMYEDFDGDGK